MVARTAIATSTGQLRLFPTAPTLPVVAGAGQRAAVDGGTDFGRRRFDRGPWRPPAPAGQTALVIDETVTVAHPWWLRAAAWLGLAAVGAGLGWLLTLVADWVAGLTWAPLQGPFELVAGLPEPHATIGALVVGALAGLVLAGFVDQEALTVRVSRTEVRLSRPGTTRIVDRPTVATAFLADERLVLLGRGSEELAREPCHLPKARLAAAFTGHGIAWADADPYADAYRRWVPETPDLPPGANALFAARERALKAGDTHDVEELRAELARLRVVVRDEAKRQYWRQF
jgi:hypothetical protein